MKIENTLENKAKFFALYWGQKILNGKFKLPSSRKISKFDYIELTPLSQITDEDAIEVAKICKPNDDHHHEVKVGKGLIRSLNETMQTFPKYNLLVDYLRSKSYLLPWMGLGQEELISYGWVKLK